MQPLKLDTLKLPEAGERPRARSRSNPPSPRLINERVEPGANEFSELIAYDVARFFPPDAKLRKEIEQFHSFAIDPPRKRIGKLPEDFPVKPVFEFDEGSLQYLANIYVDNGTSFYGTGEAPGRLLLNGRQYVCWPTDDGNWDENSDRAYQAHPFVLAVRREGTAFGCIFDTSFMVTINLENGISATSAHPFSVVVIDRASPQEVVMALAELTGKMNLPPKWSLGYQQCKWSYHPQEQALDIAKEFRNRKIPADVIWLDIHYMDGYRIFTFDPVEFPHPEKLNAELHDIGFHAAWMIDPGVKQEEGYFVHDQLIEKDLAVKTATGDNFIGSVWPGPCVFPDFTMEETREWWGGLYKNYMAKGVDGVWNDMNEPAVFDTPTKTMPETNKHRGFGGGTHERFHNVYGMLMARASYDGIRKANPNKRPFILSRANYLGGQRYCATWTGDNHSNWTHLHMSISMVLNLGLSGQPFSGPDIGGFADNADPKLFGRWMGFGALLPFARGHTSLDTLPHEPWEFGQEVEDICRVAISRRMMLLPYMYTLFYISSQRGLPICQPLFFADPGDPKLRPEDRAFLLGENVLVSVNIHEGNRHGAIAYPAAHKWYELKLDNTQNLELPELRIKAGSIIPIQAVIQSTVYTPEWISLIIALDENKQATGISYDDAGDGYEYKDGVFLFTTYTASLKHKHFTLNIKEEGTYPRRQNIELRIRIIIDETREVLYTIDNQKFTDKIEFELSEATVQ